MSGARVKSKAMSFPRLEVPLSDEHRPCGPARRRLQGFAVTGMGEGWLNLARLHSAKYVALVIIAVLAAALRAHP